MTNIKLFLFNFVTLLFGVLFCLLVFVSIWSVGFNGLKNHQTLFYIIITILFLVLCVVSRKLKHKWAIKKSVYVSKEVFVEYIEENKSPIIQIGKSLFGQVGWFAEYLQYGNNFKTAEEFYEYLHQEMKKGKILESEFTDRINKVIGICQGSFVFFHFINQQVSPNL